MILVNIIHGKRALLVIALIRQSLISPLLHFIVKIKIKFSFPLTIYKIIETITCTAIQQLKQVTESNSTPLHFSLQSW